MRRGRFAKAPAWVVLGAFSALLAATPACSLGEGEGEVYSDLLYAVSCWNDRYDMGPDFFAAEPFRNTMQIRVQHGSDLGRRLLDAALDGGGAASLWVATGNDRATAFYAKHGFAPDGQVKAHAATGIAEERWVRPAG